MKSRLKTTFVLTVTVLAVAFATLCVAGRIIAWRVPHHEHTINQWFATQDIEIEGPKLRWSGLNAIVELDKLTTPSVTGQNIRLELDFLLSLWRNQISFAALEIEDLQFALENSGDGWMPLGGDSSSTNGNVLSWIWNASSVDVRLKGTLANGEVRQHIEGAIQTQTRRGLQHTHITLRSPQSCDTCGLHLHLEKRKSLIFSDDVLALNVRVNELRLNPVLFDLDYLRPFDVNGTLGLVMRNEVGRAKIDFEIQRPNTSAESVVFAGQFVGNVVKDVAHGALIHSSVSLGAEATPLPEVHFVVRTQPLTTHGWFAESDSQGIVQIVEGFAEPTHPLHAWVSNLSPNAKFKLFQAFYDQRGLALRSILEDFQTQSYGGVPRIQAESIEIAGKNRSILVSSPGQQVEFEFEALLDGLKQFDEFEGSLLIAFAGDATGVRLDMTNALYQDSLLAAKFGYLRDAFERESSLGLAIQSDGFDLKELRELVPTNVPEIAKTWLESNVLGGRTFETQAVLHSIAIDDFDLHPLVVEAYGRLDEVEISYSSNWPVLKELKGELWLTRHSLDVLVESTHSQGIAVSSGRVHIPFGDGDIEVDFAADSPASLALDFVRSTPLRDRLEFETSDFLASGPLDIEARMLMSMNEGVSSLDVSIAFVDVDLDIASVGLGVQDLSGAVRYTSPFSIVGTGLSATLFDHEAAIQINTTNPHKDDALVSIALDGMVSPQDVSQLVGGWLTDVASGETEFHLELKIANDATAVSELTANSDLHGIQLNLPDPFGKKADEMRPASFSMDLATNPTVHFKSRELDSVFLLQSNKDPVGSIGLNVAPIPLTSVESGLLVTGNLDTVVLDFELSQGSGQFPTELTIRELLVRHADIGEFPMSNVQVDGKISRNEIDLSVQSDELVGTAKRSGEGRLSVDVERVQLVQGESDTQDSLSPEIVSFLPNLDLTIGNIVIVDPDGTPASFGSWTLSIDVEGDELSVSGMQGEVRGLTIQGQLSWDVSANSSNFAGSVQATELQDVLQQWDYDPNVESESFSVAANLSWMGSPLNLELYSTQGSLIGDLKDGRFIDVNAGGGALRIIGLLSFTAFLDRLRLNFRDVFGEGTRFNRILFDVDLDEGVLRTNQPVLIKTNGSDISFAGDMNLNSDTVDMEVVVTLPVAGSIPWYVALATGSPVAVITTLAAKKLFEGQIDQMSSSKYRVTGTIDDPKVELVGVFRDSLDSTEEVNEDQSTPSKEEPEQ